MGMRGIDDGMVVYSADGERLGKVISCQSTGFFVEKGFFFPKEYFARYEDIATITGEDVRLTLAKDALSRLGEAGGRIPEGEGRRTGEATFQRETMSMPVTEEEVEIRKRPVVKEEVRLRRDRVEHEQRADAEVRRETVDLEQEPGRTTTAREPGLGAPGRDEDLDR